MRLSRALVCAIFSFPLLLIACDDDNSSAPQLDPSVNTDLRESEPNDSLEDATQVGVNQTIDGRIGADDREDWLAFTVEADGMVQVLLSHLDRLGSETQLDHVAIFAEGDSALTSTTSIEAGSTVTSEPIAVVAGQTFHVQLVSSAASAAPYALAVVHEGLDADAREPASEGAVAIPAHVELLRSRIGYTDADGASALDVVDDYNFSPVIDGSVRIMIRNLHGDTVLRGGIGPIDLLAAGLPFVSLAGAGIDPGTFVTSRPIEVERGTIYTLRLQTSHACCANAAPYELALQNSFPDLDEPDNNASEGSTVLAAPSDAVTALIGDVEDAVDHFIFTAPADGHWTVQVENTLPAGAENGAIGSVTLHGVAEGGQIMPGDTFGGPELALVEGFTYVAAVAADAQSSARYTLSSMFSPRTYGDLGEPNGEPNLATPLQFGEEVQASIGFSADPEDHYALTLLGPSIAEITLTNEHVDGIRNGLLAGAEVRTSALLPIATFPDLEPQQMTTLRVASSGELLLRLAARPAAGAPYSLATSFTQLLAPDSGEPNDDFATAMPLLFGTGFLATVGFGVDQADNYRFELPGPGIVTVTVRATLVDVENAMVTSSAILDSAGETVVRSGPASSSRPATNRVAFGDGGIAVAEIVGTSGDATSYELTSSFEALDELDQEPNDTTETAQPLLVGIVRAGTLGRLGDAVDTYKLTISERRQLEVRVVNRYPAGVAQAELGRLRLLDASMAEVLVVAESVRPAQEVTVELDIDAGDYFLVFERAAGGTAPYDLTARFTP